MIDDNKMKVYVIGAFGSQHKLYKKIDEQFLKNKYQAHRLAIKDECYDSPIFKAQSIEYEVYCKRILGLFCIDQHYFFDLLMKASNEKLFNYLNNEDVACDLFKIFEMCLNSKTDGQENLDMVTLAFGYARWHKRAWINVEAMQTCEKMIEDQFADFGRKSTLNLLNADKKRCRHAWSEFCMIHGIAKKPKTFYEFYVDVTARLEEYGINRYQAGLHSIPVTMQSDGIDGLFLLGSEINEDDILICVRNYLERFSEGVKPNYDAMIEHMITSLYVMALIREFKKVKVYYFKHNQETVFREMENYEEIIKNQNEQLLKANLETNKLRSERDILRKNKIESEKLLLGELAKSQKPLKEEIKELEKKLKNEREEIQAHEQELKRLRLVLLAQKPEYKISHESAKLEVNQHKKLMYVSSRDYATMKIKGLKEEIPHLMIYEGNMPEKATAIFIDYKQISHSDYYEVIGWAKRKKIPYHFIQSKGVGETIAEMAVTLKNCES